MKKNKLLDILLAVLPVVAVVLNAMPNALELRFLTDEGERIIQYYSGFNLLPVTYMVFGAFLGGASAALVAILGIVGIFRDNTQLRNWMFGISLYGVVMILTCVVMKSMTQLLWIVCALLALEVVLLHYKRKHM